MSVFFLPYKHLYQPPKNVYSLQIDLSTWDQIDSLIHLCHVLIFIQLLSPTISLYDSLIWYHDSLCYFDMSFILIYRCYTFSSLICILLSSLMMHFLLPTSLLFFSLLKIVYIYIYISSFSLSNFLYGFYYVALLNMLFAFFFPKLYFATCTAFTSKHLRC